MIDAEAVNAATSKTAKNARNLPSDNLILKILCVAPIDPRID